MEHGTWNMEHEKQTCVISENKNNNNNNNEIKQKQKQKITNQNLKKKRKTERKMKMTAMSQVSQFKSNPFLSVRFDISLITSLSLSPNFVLHGIRENFRGNEDQKFENLQQETLERFVNGRRCVPFSAYRVGKIFIFGFANFEQNGRTRVFHGKILCKVSRNAVLLQVKEKFCVMIFWEKQLFSAVVHRWFERG